MNIFFSYAHVDDAQIREDVSPWVKTLLQCLEKKIAEKLGRKEFFNTWLDVRELRGNDIVNSRILNAIASADCFVLVLSPGYLASEYCLRELEHFRISHPEDYLNRCFVIEKNQISSDPDALDGLFKLKRYQFWYFDETSTPRTYCDPALNFSHQKYFSNIEDIAIDIGSVYQIVSKETSKKTGPGIYLAWTTDDLDVQRDSVRRYLEQVDFDVFPKQSYPLGGSEFLSILTKELISCDYFIQLVKGFGKTPPDLPAGYVKSQYHTAKEKGLNILQWRPPEIDLSNIYDENLCRFLETETVSTMPLESFKKFIVETIVHDQTVRDRPNRTYPIIFIHAEPRDMDFAVEVQEAIKDKVGSTLPLTRGSPTEIRKDIEQNFEECDGLIVIYGEDNARWVKRQLLLFNKHSWKRSKDIEGLAVGDGPPEKKPDLPVHLPGLQVLDFRHGIDRRALSDFVERLH